MKVRAAIVASAVALSLTACSAQEDAAESDGTWVGTITTEGNVTTVVNESGSMWGGTATLVEEASIGVDLGDDAYMFGYVHGTYATDDEIFVLDTQVPALRVYDMNGNHLHDIGGQGEGPGEFRYPAWVAGTPDGRVFVQAGDRVNVYSAEGEVLDPIPIGLADCCVVPTTVTPEGVALVASRHVDTETESVAFGLQRFNTDGPIGSFIVPPGIGYEPIQVSVGNRAAYVRFVPSHTWAPAPWGAVVGGIPDRYRFEIQAFDGDTIVVERAVEPVPVHPGEREWWRRYTVASTRARHDAGWTWDGAEMPDVKPAYFALIPTYDEHVWVTREGPATQERECIKEITPENLAEAVDNRCWREESIIDVFDADGRFLGQVGHPGGNPWLIAQGLFVRGRMVLMWDTDDAGVHRMKRYRLVLPGEEGQ